MLNETSKYTGVWPVMLTPFNDDREIDWQSLEKLIDWYIDANVSGLFANCQSSEMFYLTDTESVELTKFIVDYVAGRVPIVASGHTADNLSEQVLQVNRIAETGVDTVILISNRLASFEENDAMALSRLKSLVSNIDKNINLGIYECPYPYKRLISDEMLKWCVDSKRFTFIKDTCCQIDTIKRRLKIVEGSDLHIANANGQTLLASLQAGCHGYSGVMANFHPELYVWLCKHWKEDQEKVNEISEFLSLASLVENLDYPVCAKDFHKRIGNFSSEKSRAKGSQVFYSAHFLSTVMQMENMANKIKSIL